MTQHLSKYVSTKDSHFCKSDLKERGWTDGLIQKFLGEPDATKPNPHSSTQPPMKLWERSRVEKVEAGCEFQSALEALKSRRSKSSEQMKQRMAKARDETRDWVSSVDITIPRMREPKLFETACNHYVDQKTAFLEERNREYFEPVEAPDPETCDRSFLERITVNFLRHECTHYEDLLDAAAGKAGVNEARDLIRNRVLDKIAEVYPFLKAECCRQKRSGKTEAEQMIRERL